MKIKISFLIFLSFFFFTSFVPQIAAQWNSMPGNYSGSDIQTSFSTTSPGFHGNNAGMLKLSGTSQWNGMDSYFLTGKFWGSGYAGTVSTSTLGILTDVSVASMSGCNSVSVIFFLKFADGTLYSITREFTPSDLGVRKTIVLEFAPPTSGTVSIMGIQILSVSSSQSFVDVSVRVDFLRVQNGTSVIILESFGDALTFVGDSPHIIPTKFALHQNYPNPFNPTTSISFSIPTAAFINVNVYDALGGKVATVHEGRLYMGEHIFTFDGSKLSSGIYFCVLTGAGERLIKKMVLLK